VQSPLLEKAGRCKTIIIFRNNIMIGFLVGFVIAWITEVIKYFKK